MMSFKQLPYLAQIGIVALVIVLLAAGSYFLELQPLEKANQADALILQSKQAEIAQLAPYRQKLAELNAQTQALKVQMEEQSKIVPEEKEVPSFIVQVEHESAAAGVEVRRYTPAATTKKEYYTEVPFDIDVDGPYYAVVNFYDRLAKMQRIVNVSRLTMGSLRGGKTGIKRAYPWSAKETVGANCLLTTFYSNPKAATPPPVAAKARRQGRP
jgi:type IV pilus assembly protein PilO